MLTVTRESQDKLTAEEWQFYADITNDESRLLIRLRGYRLFARATKRHGYRAVKTYESHSKRDSNIAIVEVPTPQDVADEALAILVRSIDFQWESK